MGRYDVENMVLYVSRGIGMEGMAAPRARFFCPPEIVCIDVLGQG
jgi:predicted MPP superfamily phosphohydrolase